MPNDKSPLPVLQRQAIADGLALVFKGIECMRSAYPHRRFTVDGRLVGDIGEIIAQLEYDVTLDVVSQRHYDGITTDGRRVQVKATFKDSLTFSTTPDFYLGFKLYPDGRHDEVYNGPGQPIYERYAHRAGIGRTLLSFPIRELGQLSAQIPAAQKIPRRVA